MNELSKLRAIGAFCFHNYLICQIQNAPVNRIDIAGRPDAVGSSTRSVHWWMRIVFAAVFVLELAAHWV